MAFWRIEVLPISPAVDPHGRGTLQMLRDFGIQSVRRVDTSRIFLIEIQAGSDATERIARELLTDPVTERFERSPQGTAPRRPEGWALEVHLRPGVMDPVALSTTQAVADLGYACASVRTARRYVLSPTPSEAEAVRIRRLLGNESIEEVVDGGRPAGPPPKPQRHEFRLRRVPLRELNTDELGKLSRQGHLFLSVPEMQAIQAHFASLGREPTDLELETLAQTWSEHCVHKTLKSAVTYRGAPMPGDKATKRRSDEAEGQAPAEAGKLRHEGTKGESVVTLHFSNLLKDTIARATRELNDEKRGPDCLSVFKDNAGIIAFDDEYGIAFKVETHNHPSAIEPYGGAATGVGGCIRDVIGCGLGAKPIADTDVFCVAPPDWPIDQVPKGVIHPKTVLRGIVAGVRDYGNRMGIPTVNGAVHFDPRYLGNPLVFCGSIGLIPRNRIEKRANPGDLIVLVGGRTGRDGIHGATFSSAELTDTHADEFSHAVQIGNAIEEKKFLDVILQARDHADGCLYAAITDCGAGGLSSAVGEMAAETGAVVELERAPLKYEGLGYDEIWISESQERMVLAVPPENAEKLQRLFAGENVEAIVIGRFTDSGRLIVRYAGTMVGELDLAFLHNGLPKATRQAEWFPHPERTGVTGPGLRTREAGRRRAELQVMDELKRRLSDPTIASKAWITHQYDHEVQGRSVIKPLAGPCEGPSDAAVLRPRLDSNRGIAVGCGLCPQISDVDPYWMAAAAIDEAIRNVVCVGGDPSRTAILDNFCWGRVEDPKQLGALVRACQGCYDAAKAYGVPFISGKDSLNNEFALSRSDVEVVRSALRHLGYEPNAAGFRSLHESERLAIPGTLLISAVSLIDDVRLCVTMDIKQGDDAYLYLVGMPTMLQATNWPANPAFSIREAAEVHAWVARLIRERLVVSAHDVSDGGLLVACSEMAMAANRTCRVRAQGQWRVKGPEGSLAWAPADQQAYVDACFRQLPATYIVEVASNRWDDFLEVVHSNSGSMLPLADLGAGIYQYVREGEFVICDPGGHPSEIIALDELRAAWQAPLNW